MKNSRVKYLAKHYLYYDKNRYQNSSENSIAQITIPAPTAGLPNSSRSFSAYSVCDSCCKEHGRSDRHGGVEMICNEQGLLIGRG